jgi:hypothetical protein
MRWWQPQDLVNAGRLPGVLRFLAIWFSACVLCILTGLLTPTWSGIAVRLGLLSFDVSFYPPLALCVLLTLWVGPFWGIVPAYITSILIALHRGMPLGTSAVFALATPITLTVLWSSMVMLEVAPSLRRWQDLGRFAVLTLIATGTSSVGAMVWNYHHVLPFSRAHAIWQGWVLGDFLQVVLVVGTLLRIFHHPAQKWLAAQIGVATRVSLSTRFYIAVFILIFVAMAAAGTAAGKLFLASLNSSPGTATISLSLLHTALREAAFFLGIYFSVVLSAIIVFSSTLGSQVERHLRDISERKRVQEEKEKLIAELQAALSKVKLLSGMLPICANCKKIRDDKGYWKRIETYIRDHSEAEFSHSICPQCMERLYPEYAGDADDPGFERTRRMYT